MNVRAYLKKNPAALNIKDKSGFTPLMMAIKKGFLSMTSTILQFNPNL